VTATVGRGSCSDCWQAKPGGQPAIHDAGPRTERLFDFDWGWLEIAPGWWLVGALAGVLTIIVIVVTHL